MAQKEVGHRTIKSREVTAVAKRSSGPFDYTDGMVRADGSSGLEPKWP